MKAWRRQQVEDIAFITLLDFRRQTGRPLRAPVDVDLVGEIVCGLLWDWDELPEPPRTKVLAGLFPDQGRVVMNEKHAEEFRRKPGLERFTKAHEVGHWLLHVDHNNLQQNPQILIEADAHQPSFWSQQEARTSLQIDWRERHADWFAAALLMPANLFIAVAEEFDLREWKSLYALARRFDVTISALCVRLEQLGLAAVDANGRIHVTASQRHS
ncbi:MAG: hypothetical protein JWN98_356 [Abditibacteriota bacterium]|nr:hypothetical protein [Abditibacteriota bacterium]